MKKVEITSTGKYKEFHTKGTIVEVSEEMAKILVDKGAATLGAKKTKEKQPTEE